MSKRNLDSAIKNMSELLGDLDISDEMINLSSIED